MQTSIPHALNDLTVESGARDCRQQGFDPSFLPASELRRFVSGCGDLPFSLSGGGRNFPYKLVVGGLIWGWACLVGS